MPFSCVIHGSFRKHLAEIKEATRIFSAAGIQVLAPTAVEVLAEKDGFSFFEGEQDSDPRLIELLYLRNLKKVGKQGFSYFVDPEGYIGRTASYELGIAQVTNIPCFFWSAPADHPVYTHRNSIWRPADLAAFIAENDALPAPHISPDETAIHKLWEDLMVPGSVVAAGGIIEYDSGRSTRERELLFVKTHKWGGRYSMVGGKVRRNETLTDAIRREILEETGLGIKVDRHLCTFDQIKNSGYYQSGMQYIFADYVVSADSKNVVLNEEAEDYAWIPASAALRDLDIEPNARHTLQLYADSLVRQPA